jgi:hypothetical protein
VGIKRGEGGQDQGIPDWMDSIGFLTGNVHNSLVRSLLGLERANLHIMLPRTCMTMPG